MTLSLLNFTQAVASESSHQTKNTSRFQGWSPVLPCDHQTRKITISTSIAKQTALGQKRTKTRRPNSTPDTFSPALSFSYHIILNGILVFFTGKPKEWIEKSFCPKRWALNLNGEALNFLGLQAITSCEMWFTCPSRLAVSLCPPDLSIQDIMGCFPINCFSQEIQREHF